MYRNQRLTGLDSNNMEGLLPPVPGVKPFISIAGMDIYIADNLEIISKQWKQFEARAVATPFQNYDWVSQWYCKQGKAQIAELKILLVYEGHELRMIVPLAIEQKAGLRRLIWLAHQINDYNAPLVDPAWLETISSGKAHYIWERMISGVGDVDYIELTKQPLLIGSTKNPFSKVRSGQFSCSAYYLDLGPNWTEFYSELRSVKSRKRLQGKERKLKKAGRFSFRQVRRPSEKIAMVQTLVKWKSDQLDARGARNPFSDGKLQQVLEQVSSQKTASRFLRVHALEIDSVPVAASIVLVQGDTMNLFMAGYDGNVYRNCSTGSLLLIKLMELATRSGLKTFDFSAGDEPYKSEWSAQPMEMTYTVYGRSLVGRIAAGWVKTLIGLKRLIKSSDFLMAAFQGVNFHLMAMRDTTKSRGEARFDKTAFEQRISEFQPVSCRDRDWLQRVEVSLIGRQPVKSRMRSPGVVKGQIIAGGG